MSMRAFFLAVTGFVISVAACSSSESNVFEVDKTPAPVASVAVIVPSSLTAGQTARATAVTKDASGATLSGRSVKWVTSSESVASVTDSGMISAVAPGTAIVSATSEGVEGEATLAVVSPAPAPIASISVSVNPSSILTGQTAQASATPLDGIGAALTGRTIAWQSSNSGIASVSQAGVVTAGSSGTATITASSEGIDGSATVSVSAPAPIPVASVSVSPTSSSLLVGATVQLSATTRDGGNNVLAGRVVTWSSANTAIARVSSSGLVTAVAAGNVSITASSEGKTASAAITVTAPAPVPVATVSVSPTSSSLLVGATVQLSATTRDAGNNVLTGRVVTWSSSATGIASVNSNSGLVTAVAAGTATITATSEGKTASAVITVTAPAPAPVATVSVSPSSSSLFVGATTSLSATTRDASNNVLTGRVVTWSSSATGIASVNSNSGVVTAIAVGTATITATSEGKTGTGSISVAVPPPPGSSNEPSGMTLIDERPFNSLNEHAAPNNPAWDTDNTLSIVQDPTAPKSPSGVLRNTFPTGFTGGGSAGGHAGVLLAGNYRVLYISYWAKYSANWYGHETGINKHVYAWAGDYPPFVMEADGSGTGPLRPRPALQRMISGDGMYTNNLVPSAVIPRGAWFHIEIVLNGNTSGTANGSMDWWLDGVHVGSVGGLQYTSGTTAWNVFEMYPVWGGVGTITVPSTQTLDWDHVYLSGKQ
jgi:uncharacterized protein YjdB